MATSAQLLPRFREHVSATTRREYPGMAARRNAYHSSKQNIVPSTAACEFQYLGNANLTAWSPTAARESKHPGMAKKAERRPQASQCPKKSAFLGRRLKSGRPFAHHVSNHVAPLPISSIWIDNKYVAYPLLRTIAGTTSSCHEGRCTNTCKSAKNLVLSKAAQSVLHVPMIACSVIRVCHCRRIITCTTGILQLNWNLRLHDAVS